MEALQMQETRNMKLLGEKLSHIHDVSGTSYQSIADAAEVNRSCVSMLANRGAASITAEGVARLWAWVDSWEASQGMQAKPAATGTKQTPELIRTKDLLGALGFCDFCIQHREIGVVMGMPGTGKTTVAGIVSSKLTHAIYIEAWLSMRLGDLLDEIGTGLGLELRGTLDSRTQKLIRALKQRPDTVILVDEAEYLKKWNVEKLDVLRKIHDNTGVTILLFGTPALANVLNRRDTTQLSRRMFQYAFSGARKDEIRAALQGYDCEAEVVEKLAAMAADTTHGGMGTYTKMLELCLYAAQGGRITAATLAEAVMYKPGL
ncbi:MAG: ATP-binding protein [Clostridia bacterium]|nr:ATP-binding protein [Clostridia bacterium]